MLHSVGLWVVIAVVAFSLGWRVFIVRYARKRGWQPSRGGKIKYGDGDVMYHPDLGDSQRGPGGGGHGHHHGGGGFSGGGHHGGGWGGGGGDSGGGGHHH